MCNVLVLVVNSPLHNCYTKSWQTMACKKLGAPEPYDREGPYKFITSWHNIAYFDLYQIVIKFDKKHLQWIYFVILQKEIKILQDMILNYYNILLRHIMGKDLGFWEIALSVKITIYKLLGFKLIFGVTYTYPTKQWEYIYCTINKCSICDINEIQ